MMALHCKPRHGWSPYKKWRRLENAVGSSPSLCFETHSGTAGSVDTTGMFLTYTLYGATGELSLVRCKPGFIPSCGTHFIFYLLQLLILGSRNAKTVVSPFARRGERRKYRTSNHKEIKSLDTNGVFFTNSLRNHQTFMPVFQSAVSIWWAVFILGELWE